MISVLRFAAIDSRRIGKLSNEQYTWQSKKGHSMKRLRKLAGILLAFAVCLGMLVTAAPAKATETETTAATTGSDNSLTINNTGNTAHTFELYQIFTGDLHEDSDKTIELSNIKWGNGVSEAGKTALGDAAAKAKTITDATAFANEVKGYLTSATTSESVAAGSSYKFDHLAAGYYLVKDADGSQKGTEGAYTSYIVQVIGSVTQDTKLDVPTVVKKVQDKNDSTGDTTGWQDSADYDIGDAVPYQITGSMPSNIDKYTTYQYVFTDTMSKGLTYTENTAKIKIGDTDVTGSFNEKVTSNDDGSTTVTWSCNNLKGISGVTLDANTKVVVSYNCTLNENAEIGAAGNPNTVNLTFSNNPNQGGEGETGKTPDDKNIVFTYKVVVNKVDQNNKALAGAEFTLSKVKADNTSETVKTFTLTGNAEKDATTFIASGLDDGTYVLKETKTPAGYNTIADQYFTITADHDTESADPQLTKLSGDKLTGSAQATITFTPNTKDGSLTTDVVNEKGSNLPSTGGAGTRALYTAGVILLAAGLILIVIRRRRAQAQ